MVSDKICFEKASYLSVNRLKQHKAKKSKLLWFLMIPNNFSMLRNVWSTVDLSCQMVNGSHSPVNLFTGNTFWNSYYL